MTTNGVSGLVNTRHRHDIKRPNELSSSAAAAALSDKELCQTIIAAAGGCGDWFGQACIRNTLPLLLRFSCLLQFRKERCRYVTFEQLLP